MRERKRHSQADIVTKLAEAQVLIAQGKRQQDVASAIGVSVMTFHRWRKAQSAPPSLTQSISRSHTGHIDQSSNPKMQDQFATLQLENLRLRRLLTDVLLEKIKLEETILRPSLDGEMIERASH
jgi:putative transposase